MRIMSLLCQFEICSHVNTRSKICAFNNYIIPQDEIFLIDAAFASYRDSLDGDDQIKSLAPAL